MKKYILLIVVFSFIALISAASVEMSNEGKDIKRIINLDSIVETIRTFFGLDDVLETTYAGSGGDCVLVNPEETGLIFGNCSNATGGGGSGDITSVIGDNWITNGSVTGDVNLIFNETLANENFVNVVGDTMTGNLNIQKADSPTISTVDTTNTVSTIQQS